MTSRPDDRDVLFFERPDQLRDWFDANHESARELWLGYWKKAAGRPTVTWAQAVDEALCVGWIDTTRYSVDELRSRQRFTPRRKGSNWSAVNIRRVGELEAEGRMTDAGRRAFALRDEAKSRIYSYERAAAAFDADAEATFRANETAWSWFEKAAPSYRKGATYWVTSAKKQETRDRRLALLIEHSANGRQVPPLTSPAVTRERT